MRRIITGLCFICNLIINTAMLITFIVISILADKLNLQIEKSVSLFALITSIILSIALYIYYRRLSKQAKKKPKIRGIIKDFANELKGIETAYACYIEEDNNLESVIDKVDKNSDTE